MLTWDLKSNKLTQGQWLKHRVYSEYADLSPDGRHLIYHAATHKPDPVAGGGIWPCLARHTSLRLRFILC